MNLPLDSLQTDLLILVFSKVSQNSSVFDFFQLSNRSLCRFRRTSSSMNSLIEKHKKTFESRSLFLDFIWFNLQNDDKNWVFILFLSQQYNPLKDSFFAIRVSEKRERVEIEKNLSGICINRVYLVGRKSLPSFISFQAPLGFRNAESDDFEEDWPLLIKAFKNLELTYDVLDCADIPDDYLAEIISLSKARKQNIIEYKWKDAVGALKKLQKVRNVGENQGF